MMFEIGKDNDVVITVQNPLACMCYYFARLLYHPNSRIIDYASYPLSFRKKC